MVTVACYVAEECVLPCRFKPDSEVNIEWFRQDVMILKVEQDEENNSSEQRVLQEQFAGRVSISAPLVSRGDATLILKKSSLKDRGTYRCQVQTSEGEHNAKVILKVGGESRQRAATCSVTLLQYVLGNYRSRFRSAKDYGQLL